MSHTPSVAVSGLARRPREAYYELALLAMLASLLTYFAVRAFPLWDDAFTLLEADRGGARAVFDSMADRPVLGKLFSLMINSNHLIAVGAVLHWLAWFGTGWVTMRLWKILFPSRPELALPAACLALAPLLCRVQLALLSSVLSCLVGPLMAWLVVLPLLAPKAAAAKPSRTVVLHVAMAIVVAAAALISEYVVPTAIAGAVLLAGLGPRAEGKPKQTWITIGLLLFSAAAGYAVYHHLGNAEFRPGIRPEMQDWSWRITVIAPRLLTATWEATLGLLFGRIGEMDFSSGREMLIGLFAGFAGAAAAHWISRRYGGGATVDDDGRFLNPRVLLTLGLAIVAGLLPIVAMGQELRTWSGSRLFSTILPVESCLGVALLSLLLRRRFWRILPAGIGLLATYYLVSDGLLAIHERQAVEQLGDRLASYVPDDGLTVAFMNRNWRYPRGRAPNESELIARLTVHWSPEKRAHFFAFAGAGPALHDPKAVSANMRQAVVLDPYGENPRLSRPWLDQAAAANAPKASGPEHKADSSDSRNFAASITQMIWVSEEASGRLFVERWHISKGRSP